MSELIHLPQQSEDLVDYSNPLMDQIGDFLEYDLKLNEHFVNFVLRDIDSDLCRVFGENDETVGMADICRVINTQFITHQYAMNEELEAAMCKILNHFEDLPPSAAQRAPSNEDLPPSAAQRAPRMETKETEPEEPTKFLFDYFDNEFQVLRKD
jgi:hypothetical protein